MFLFPGPFVPRMPTMSAVEIVFGGGDVGFTRVGKGL
jgi:hypothetical protein